MKKKDIGFLFLSCVSCVLVILGIFHCLDVYQGYQYGRDEYISLNRRYTRVTEKDIPKTSKKETELIREDDVVEAPQDAPESLNIDWDELKQINSDIIAWIQIPAVNLSYPVLQGEDNDYYLHRDFYKSYLYAGSIFLDCNNNADFLNYNSIVYGHNMLDQSMFARHKEFNDSDILQIHQKLMVVSQEEFRILARCRDPDESIEFNDNVLSAYVTRNGKCYVSDMKLNPNDMCSLRKVPLDRGGSNKHTNIIFLEKGIAKALLCADVNRCMELLRMAKIKVSMLANFNELRRCYGFKPIHDNQSFA